MEGETTGNGKRNCEYTVDRKYIDISYWKGRAYIVDNRKIVILIPAYEPSEELLYLIKDLSSESIKNMGGGYANIVIVNDGSRSDKSKDVFEELRKFQCCVIENAINLGKGKALKNGIHYIRDHYADADAIVTVDADGQHTRDAVDDCVQAFYQAKKAKIILGARKLETKQVPVRSRFGNIITRLVFKYLCGIGVSDTQTGLRVIPNNYWEKCLEIKGEKYEYETNVLLRAKKDGMEFVEVPIKTIYLQNNSSSHFNPIRDSFLIYKTILLYTVSSGMSTLVDYVLFILLTRLGASIWLATGTSRLCSASVNFFTNKRLVFRSKENVLGQISGYVSLVIFSGVMSALGVSVFVKRAGWNRVPSKVLVDAILYFFNYYAQKKVVFR